MVHITLDGEKMTHKEEVHAYLKSELPLNGYYGSNLDALWDALSTYNHPIEIVLIHRQPMLAYLGNYGKSVIKVFEDAAKENPNIKFTMV
ncbi:barstar family protein [Virgibacillus kimchii]